MDTYSSYYKSGSQYIWYLSLFAIDLSHPDDSGPVPDEMPNYGDQLYEASALAFVDSTHAYAAQSYAYNDYGCGPHSQLLTLIKSGGAWNVSASYPWTDPSVGYPCLLSFLNQGTGINGLAVDPNNSNVLWVATGVDKGDSGYKQTCSSNPHNCETVGTFAGSIAKVDFSTSPPTITTFYYNNLPQVTGGLVGLVFAPPLNQISSPSPTPTPAPRAGAKWEPIREIIFN